jgi:hypothetical protein
MHSGLHKMTRGVFAGLALLLVTGAGAPAEEQRIWLAGWGETGEGGANAQPFIPEGAAEDFIPAGFKALGGRKMHVLSQAGERDTGILAPIEPVEEAVSCGPRIGFTEPLNITPAQLYLASTDPISVADAKGIAKTDPRLVKGIAAYLAGKGVAKPKVTIARAVAADLDGDGKAEAIVEAITKGRGVAEFYEQEQPGDFSFVAVGALSDAGFVVGGHAGYIFGFDMEHSVAAQFGIQALPDFTGNGHFDLAVAQAGYEWMSLDVYAWSDGKLKPLASAYCGV